MPSACGGGDLPSGFDPQHHTRYLHEGILDYVERLTATFDKSLDAAILTCTGSEANGRGSRMAQAVPGKTGIIATDFTYRGNTG